MRARHTDEPGGEVARHGWYPCTRSTAQTSIGCMEATRRVCAKVLLVDAQDRVLLFSGIDRELPDEPPVWFPVGGGIDDGETLEEAAIRETFEETGIAIAHPGPALFSRRFRWVFEGVPYDQEETYFLVRVQEAAPVDARWTDVERATITGYRWWTLDELRQTTDIVFPDGLAQRLEVLLHRERDA